MSRPPGRGQAEPIDLCGRILMTHALDPCLVERALGVSAGDARAMVLGEPMSAALGRDQLDRLLLLTNILVRLEIVCRHDPRAIRTALYAPLDALGGAAPAERLGDGIAALRTVRAAIDHVEVAKVGWWRVGH